MRGGVIAIAPRRAKRGGGSNLTIWSEYGPETGWNRIIVIMLNKICSNISTLAFYNYLKLYRCAYCCAAERQYLTIWSKMCNCARLCASLSRCAKSPSFALLLHDLSVLDIVHVTKQLRCLRVQIVHADVDRDVLLPHVVLLVQLRRDPLVGVHLKP